MDYLFFDIECANCNEGAKICEFGYVIANHNFEKIEQKNILINPNAPFDEFVINSLLNYKKEEYDKSPLLPSVYDEIFSLLNGDRYIVVGHTTQGDAEHVAEDCIRYGLKSPDFHFIDIVELYKHFSKKDKATGLTKMCEELGIVVDGHAHSADVDADLTMRVAFALTKKFKKSFDELVAQTPHAKGEVKDYEETWRRKTTYRNYLAEVEEAGLAMQKDGKTKLHLFIENVAPINKKRIDGVAGKRIFISPLYALAHYNENMWLVQTISNAGGYVITYPKRADMFVRYDARTKAGEEVFCKQFEAVKKLNEKGAGKQIVDFYDFLDMLGVKESDLKKPFDIDVDALVAAKSRSVYSDASPTTIGDLLKLGSSKNSKNRQNFNKNKADAKRK